jgi:hypothetical protein
MLSSGPIRSSRGSALVLSAVAATTLAAATLSGCSSSSSDTDPNSSMPGAAPTSASAAPDSASAAPSAAPAGQHITGQITAINGASWTVKAGDGSTLTVNTDSTTRFGSTKHPATAGSFAVGQTVTITGARNGDTVTATHISVHKAKHGKHSSSAAPAS